VTFFIYEVSGEVMAKFHQKPDLRRKVRSARNFSISALRPTSDGRN
jgi:hypothetical protein